MARVHSPAALPGDEALSGAAVKSAPLHRPQREVLLVALSHQEMDQVFVSALLRAIHEDEAGLEPGEAEMLPVVRE